MASNDPDLERSRIDRASGWRKLLAGALVTGMAAALGHAGSVAAGELALEIDQLCALNDGCFPGDDPGFPVTITASGRYHLTSNLTIPDTTVGGIFVDADDVEIDLGGFVVQGPVVCSGTPLVCTPSTGFADGIESALGNGGVQVRDGTVRGMPGDGLSLGRESRVTGVRAHSNGTRGISVGDDSTIADSIAYQNGGNGILVGSGSSISESVSARNELFGLSSFSYSDPVPGFVVSGSVFYQNQTSGIVPGILLTLTSSALYDNGATGVNLNEWGNVLNGNVIASHTDYGLVGGASSFTDNTIAINGVDAHPNTVSSMLGGNACGGTTTCP